MPTPCENCQQVQAVAADLLQAIDNILEADQDAASGGKPFLYPLHRRGLKAVADSGRESLAALSVNMPAKAPARTPDQQERPEQIEVELAGLPRDLAEAIRQYGKYAGHAFRVFGVLRDLPLTERWAVLELCLDVSTRWQE